MKVFLVNLDRDVARMASADAQLKKAGVPYERVSAVYGKGLAEAERRAAYSPFRWWCAMGRAIAPAEIGCAVSHFKIYRRMLEDGDLAFCCILEDDVALSSQFKSTLQDIEKWIEPTKPQLVLLNDHQHQYGDLVPGIHCSCFGGTCADGYVLTQVAARKLLEANLPMVVPCDTWGRWVRQGRIELYHAVPAVVRQMQEVFGSTTSEQRVDVSRLSFPKRFFHKVKRAIGKSLDLCLVKVTGR